VYLNTDITLTCKQIVENLTEHNFNFNNSLVFKKAENQHESHIFPIGHNKMYKQNN
jgi:hypothetical protein